MTWALVHLLRYASLALLVAGLAALAWYGTAHLFHRNATSLWVSRAIKLMAASFVLLGLSIGIAAIAA